jgi:hypothetical protein
MDKEHRDYSCPKCGRLFSVDIPTDGRQDSPTCNWCGIALKEEPTLINLTPHPISLADDAGKITWTIDPSGTVARISTSSVDAGFSVCGFPVVRNETGDVTGLPEPRMGHVYIVSMFVLSALSGRGDVIAPDTGSTCVRDEKGRILAVRQFLTI